jgi:hypothetical protein
MELDWFRNESGVAYRNCGALQVYPGLTVLGSLSRPCGTGLAEDLYPALRAGLSSAVPSGLIRYTLMTARFQEVLSKSA